MFCPKCGKQLDDDMAFCTNCGSSVRNENPAPVRHAQPSGKKPRKKGNGMLAATLVILLLTVVITALAGIMTFKMKSKKADSAVKQEQLEAKKEAQSEKKETEENKKAEEEQTNKEAENKETVDMEIEEKKEEDGPIKIGGTRPTQSSEKKPSQKKPEKAPVQKKPEKKPEPAPEVQTEKPEFQIQSSSEQSYNTESVQTPVQQPEVSPYILPQSNQVYLTNADVAHLTLQQINYAKNEIFARYGRKFASPELQNYFNKQSWYVGTIDPANFVQEDWLSQMEIDNANFLATVEHNINPNGYPLDQ